MSTSPLHTDSASASDLMPSNADAVAVSHSSDNAGPEHQEILDAALTAFSNVGYNEARLESIAGASGVSKRMIHYYYGDKKGLYMECLRYAETLLHPKAEDLIPDSDVPVEAIRQTIETLVSQFFSEPRAARMLAMENLLGILPQDVGVHIFSGSPAVLELGRLLMKGQDHGAFRPGVSAIDLYLIISALATFPSYNQSTFRSMYDVATGDDANRDGIKALIQDTVISLLTTTMTTREGDSYTVTTEQLRANERAAHAPLYGEGDLLDGSASPSPSEVNRFDEQFAPFSDFYRD
ncbi:TetR family transcriptional regulator [Corynebacterium kroppenstedtii]|uniref:TetR family transcriptional regulator n=1 Tax=Corynebacterium sp. PCR 32 TaxID=3351342 RepID=UPI00309E3DFA